MNERLLNGIDQMTRPRHQEKLNVNRKLSVQSHSGLQKKDKKKEGICQ